jgi:DNA-directed RNA polymerase specialized sigma24 family protein
MTKQFRLSPKRRQLIVDHMSLATMLAKFFVQNRPHWQRAVLIPDLEAEGYLALVKAAKTYDSKKLPYPRAYFARACLNGMYKAIKKLTRTPGVEKITIAEAAELLPEFDELDHLRLAIAELPEEDQPLAIDRFVNGATLQALADSHQIPLRVASRRATRLAKLLAESLGIQLMPPDAGSRCRLPNTNRDFPSSCRVSESPASQSSKRFRGR